MELHYNCCEIRRLNMNCSELSTKESGLHTWRRMVCLPLIPAHRQVGLQWCRTRVHWMAEWSSVLFTDERYFCSVLMMNVHELGRGKLYPLLT